MERKPTEGEPFMANRNRNYSTYEDNVDYEGRSNRESFNRQPRRGYGEDYRGYSRGYNLNQEPNYGSGYDRGPSGYGTAVDRDYGRDFSTPAFEPRRDTLYGQGPGRSHLRCREIMTREVITCRRDTPITEVARLMRDEDIGSIPVLGDDNKLEGIVTDRDIVIRGLSTDKDDVNLKAEDCMSDDLYTANHNERVVDMIQEMGDHQVRRIPVVDGRGRLVGIISMADVARETEDDMELEAALEQISKSPSWFSRLTNAIGW